MNNDDPVAVKFTEGLRRELTRGPKTPLESRYLGLRQRIAAKFGEDEGEWPLDDPDVEALGDLELKQADAAFKAKIPKDERIARALETIADELKLMNTRGLAVRLTSDIAGNLERIAGALHPITEAFARWDEQGVPVNNVGDTSLYMGPDEGEIADKVMDRIDREGVWIRKSTKPRSAKAATGATLNPSDEKVKKLKTSKKWSG